jgi:hypothetical protein
MTTIAGTEAQQSDAEPVLTPKISSRWALAPWHLLVLIFWVSFYLILSYLPLRGTDLWGHVIYGNWILENRTLPSEDPVLPFSEGMKVVDSAWLSQVVFALVEQRGGEEWLACLFALTVLSSYLLLAWTYSLQCGRFGVAMISVLAVLAVGWSRLTTIRPEIFAGLCFASLLLLIVSSKSPGTGRDIDGEGKVRSLRLWIGVPVIFLLWANLHGSFLCGWAVLGCFFLGHLIEVAWKKRNLRDVVGDTGVRRWLCLCELAFLATLINPYGIDLVIEAITFSSNDNLVDILEWQPLVVLGIGGVEYALSWLVLLVLFRHSRQRVPVAHVLMLVVFGISVVFGVRMLSWYAAIFGLVATPHIADLVARLLAWRREHVERTREHQAEREEPESEPAEEELANENVDEDIEEDEQEHEFFLPPGKSWKYSLVGGLIIWMGVAFSPLSYIVLGGKTPRTQEQMLDPETPLELTEYLRENPPQGQLFNAQWWGDWIVWDGPPGVKPFMTTNMHLVPHRVWRDYMSVLRAQADWRLILDKYRIDTVVVDRARQANLETLLRLQRDWRIAYQDEQAMVFRLSSRPTASVAPEPKEPPAKDQGSNVPSPPANTDSPQAPSKGKAAVEPKKPVETSEKDAEKPGN